jgi:hypothetical protein
MVWGCVLRSRSRTLAALVSNHSLSFRRLDATRRGCALRGREHVQRGLVVWELAAIAVTSRNRALIDSIWLVDHAAHRRWERDADSIWRLSPISVGRLRGTQVARQHPSWRPQRGPEFRFEDLFYGLGARGSQAARLRRDESSPRRSRRRFMCFIVGSEAYVVGGSSE